ncbi:MAG: acylphosphatase [Candidatus Hydrogenedens sp.]|nr:acylphosphatase [Candidatus Hydrogenedens sp.]
MSQRLHVIVRGRVQGVGFRIATMRKAQSLGLTGWVKNLPDGAVETECEGGAAAIAAMAEWLRHGPASASVTDCQSLSPHDGPPYASFEVRY